MPELPEVETVRRGLAPVLEGARIAAADIRRPDLRWPLPDRMGARLTGARVRALRRRAKILLAELDTGETWMSHLGMSGRFLIVPPEGARQALADFALAQPGLAQHDHVVLTLEDGHRIVFNDPRRFGAMDLWPTAALEAHPSLASLGPEPLGNGFHAEGLGGALAPKRTPVKAALLDQRIIAGLGNIYVCEALWRAGVSPRRLACNLGATRVARLVPAIRGVLTEAIAAGGSSLRDHAQATGELGYFQHSFRVYGRAGQPCQTPRCPGVVTRFVQSGRSTFACPKCQR